MGISDDQFGRVIWATSGSWRGDLISSPLSHLHLSVGATGDNVGVDDSDDVQCPCCRLFYAAQSPPEFPERNSPLSSLGVCWDCLNHGGDADQVKHARGWEHGRMLKQAYLRKREQVAEALAKVEEMRRELAMRPVQTVIRVENLDRIIVDVAYADRDEAARRRDVAMGALSDVRVLHHRDRDDKTRCSCRLAYDNCAVARIVDRWDGVLRWEKSEAGAAYRGRRHHLLREHPALTDEEYFKAVYGDDF